MKRFSVGLLTGLVAGLLLATVTFAFADNPPMFVVDDRVIQSDVPPQVIDGRTMVPARALAEALGASVIWDEENNIVRIVSNSESVLQQKIIYALIYKDIYEAASDFYSDYLTISPVIDLYSYNFLSIEKTDNYIYQVVVEIIPFVGAHNGVGKDQITILISPTQENQIIGFNHVESYEISEHLKSLIKQPLPNVTTRPSNRII